MGFVEKIAISYALKIIKNKLSLYEAKTPDLLEFRKAMYEKPLPEFLEYGVEKLAKKDLNGITYVDYIKNMIAPLDDNAEEVIKKVLDGLDPRN